MKNHDNTQTTLGEDFFAILDIKMACSEDIFDDVKSSTHAIGEIISRIKSRNQIENDFDKIDLDSLENLYNHLNDMLKQFKKIAK